MRSWGLALALLIAAAPAWSQATDSALVARAAFGRSVGTSTTTAMLVSGGALVLASSAFGSSDSQPTIVVTGLGLFALGGLAGPAIGWQAAGESSHALRSVLIHTTVFAAPPVFTAFLLSSRDQTSWEDAGTVAAVVLLSTIVNTVTCYHELGSFERIMRGDAAAARSVSLVPVRLSGGELALAVSIPLR